jgi:AcrR family transcriptional regulator
MSGSDRTRDRLLDAAGEEFARHGFENTTVRAILDRAGVGNLAAIHYYFGDKKRLYEQAILTAHRCGLVTECEALRDDPVSALRTYVREFLSRLLAIGSPEDWRQRLMYRELMEPTGVLDTLVSETIRPRYERLREIVRRLAPRLDERRQTAVAFSVIGQCLHYRMARPVAERLISAERFAALDLDFLTDHITRFSLAALGAGPPLGLETSTEGEVPLTDTEPDRSASCPGSR